LCFLSLIHLLHVSQTRELLLNRDIHDFKSKYPEVEGHLKLLYTGVTRCIDRLFFAETTASLSGDAFLRFMTETTSVKKDDDKKNSNNSLSIATKNNVENMENLTMTPDEVRFEFYIMSKLLLFDYYLWWQSHLALSHLISF
jgi:hypothetical protein